MSEETSASEKPTPEPGPTAGTEGAGEPVSSPEAANSEATSPEPVDPSIERANRMFEIRKTMGAAARLSSMKSSTIKGRTFKVRAPDNSMEPTIRRQDLLHVGPATLMKLKAGDLLYFHVQDEYRVRRLVRRTALGDGLAFAVRTEGSDQEELVPSQAILGKVTALDRGLETILFEKPPGTIGGRFDLDSLVERIMPPLQALVDKVRDLVERLRSRKKS